MSLKKLEKLLSAVPIKYEINFENEIYKITINQNTWWESITAKNFLYRFREIIFCSGYDSDPFNENTILITDGKDLIELDFTDFDNIKKTVTPNHGTRLANADGYRE
jgi:hypothetical protein